MKMINRFSLVLLILLAFLSVSISAQTDCGAQDYECKVSLNTKKNSD